MYHFTFHVSILPTNQTSVEFMNICSLDAHSSTTASNYHTSVTSLHFLIISIRTGGGAAALAAILPGGPLYGQFAGKKVSE